MKTETKSSVSAMGTPKTTTTKESGKEVAFQSKELEELLNIIDQLRSQGVSRYIDLPQLIVCGDQSSGKSSVLEAVSGVRFPTKDSLCTRFPTELVLRRSPEETSSITIVPDPDRCDEEKAQLQEFKIENHALEEFEYIVDAAGKAMGLGRGSKIFSTDVLRVELTGPALPHLTLVDLPGLFHAGNKTQSNDDAEAVRSLVTGYMKSPRSIILAVVSAKNEYANQIVTKYAQDVDPRGERTLGIITKPDCLPQGSESETQYVELAQNKDVHLRLGWHVLKNRDYAERDSTTEERDRSEASFFSKGIWTSLKPAQLGITSLKPRLSRVLKDHILVELPGLILDVESEIRDCESRLDKLGLSRASKDEQKLYLHKVSKEFSVYVQAAVDGRYNDLIFQDARNESAYNKRLRAVVFNSLDEFSQEMSTRGQQYRIVDTVTEPNKRTPIQITRTERLERVGELIKKHRGMELPGFQKYENITMLLREQCTPWTSIVHKYADMVFDEVKVAMYAILDKTSDEATADGIVQCILNPALEKIKAEVDIKVEQNLEQHVRGYPITFNHYFTDNLQKLRAEHEESMITEKLQYITLDGSGYLPLKAIVSALTTKTEADMDLFTCSEALHFMDAYYKVALKFFIDDFIIHTIEQGLLSKLPEIFTPEQILLLDDAVISDIAGETEESLLERESSSAKLAMLKEALRLLHRLDRGAARATSSKGREAT